MDMKCHAAGFVADGGIWVGGRVVEEFDGGSGGVIGGVGLGSGDCSDGNEHRWVDCDAVVQECSNDLLQAGHLEFVKRRAGVEIRCVLDLGAVGRSIPFVGCIFTAGWRVMLELVESGRHIFGD
jgi:hypothetical protein